MKLLRDTWIVCQRHTVLMVRNPVWILVGLAQPVCYLLLFAPLLKPALRRPGGVEAYQLFVPGLLVMLAFYTVSVGFGIIAELRAGVIERSRVTPVSRLALLLGRCLRDVAAALAQSALVIGLSVPFGLSVAVGDLVLTGLVIGLIALMMAALSYAGALRLRSEDALAPLMNALSQPVLLTAGILLPLSLAPTWLQRVADWNPFAWAVEAARALFAGNPGDSHVWQALVILGALTVLVVGWAARMFGRSVR